MGDETDVNGDASFAPKEAKTYLAVAHFDSKEAGAMAGQKTDNTK